MRSLFTALLFATCAAYGYEVKRDSSGAVVRWSAPVHFILDAQLDHQLMTVNATAAAHAALATLQSAVPALTLDAAPGRTHGVGYDFEHPSQSTSDVTVPEEWRWDLDAVAITVVSVSRSTHEILEADIAFNARHTAFAVVGAAPELSRYDVQNAMTHELGHALGLAHNPGRPESLMYPHSVPGEVSKRALAPDDLDGLRFLYLATPLAAAGPVSSQGCSSTGSAPFALLAVGLILRRRRALVAVVFAALVCVAPAIASTKSGWTVSDVRTLAPAAGPAVLESEVTLVRAGLSRTVRMAGGRWGDVEQIVEGVAVPVEGDVLADDGR